MKTLSFLADEQKWEYRTSKKRSRNTTAFVQLMLKLRTCCGVALGHRDNFCLMFASGRCCLCLSGEVAYRWQAAHFQHLSTRQHLSMSRYLNACSPQYPISRVTASNSLDTYLLHDTMVPFEPWPLKIIRWYMKISHNNRNFRL
jgi:hypothetical protein